MLLPRYLSGVHPPSQNSASLPELCAGGTGAVVGSLLSVVQRQPLVRFTAASTASFLMLAGCFSGGWPPRR